MGYGLPLLGVDVIYVATGHVDYLIVGRVLGATALGIYTLAYRLPELVVLGVVSVLSKSLFPAFSKARDSLAALQKGLRSSIRYVVIFTTPICVGLLVAARPLVLVTLGPDWTEVIPVLRVLAVFAWVRSLMSNDGDVYKAIGIPGFLAKITALRLALLIPALLFAAQFGLVAVALAHLATTIIDKTLRIFLISRRLEMKVSDIVSQFMPAVIAAVPLAAVALGMVTITANAIPIVQLTLTSLAGAFAYAVAIWLMERDSLRNIVSLMRAPRLGLEQAEGESPR
jgi:PST family polysaccharide transporter